MRAQTADAFARAVRRFRDDVWDPVRIRDHALRWDAPVFRRRLVEAVQRASQDGRHTAREPSQRTPMS